MPMRTESGRREAASSAGREACRAPRAAAIAHIAAATALFLSPPQTQVVAQFKLLSDLNQMPFTDQVGAQLREFALAKLRETLKQLFTGDQRQHSVAQKLQLLIITDLIFGFCRLLRFLLARL